MCILCSDEARLFNIYIENMCVCMYVCMYVCVCVYVCMYVCIYLYLYNMYTYIIHCRNHTHHGLFSSSYPRSSLL